MKPTTKKVLDSLWENHPNIKLCKPDIIAAWGYLYNCYKRSGRLFVCGNGGSAADAEHITGELMNKFMRRRPIPADDAELFRKAYGADAKGLCEQLQRSLPAFSLVSQAGLMTAIANDLGEEFVFAQQVYGYGRKGDALLAISTSGNSRNVLNAIRVAKVLGISTVGLTGERGGAMKGMCDAVIMVPAVSTPHIQELHQPVYHVLCEMLETEFFF